ncbi:hypothetical protein BDN72DRAFT_845720 [Pluteus cervinus]|uniref:Uncharacterized protein n=1 Tax=Pluteus cervinus TaxID=181527 RepID=A0ACD3AHU8_9AGAR|nr:hypothetical protein BDN72DRAFT_845720 [Pluteus cervinus]
MPLAFLCVFTEPGTEVTIEEYQDWYDNEHVPLRANHLHSVLTAARYRAIDDQEPGWVAVYDFDDKASFEDESYTRLRANRSPREGDLIKRLKFLDRRTCEQVADSGEVALTTSFKPGNPSRWLVIHGLNTKDGTNEQAKAWFNKQVSRFKETKVEAWARTRLEDCYDSGKTGLGVGKGPEEQVVPKFLVVHEFDSIDAARQFSTDIVVDDAVTVLEVRVFELYRAYPCIAQGPIS